MPDPRPKAETDLSAGPKQVSGEMAEAEVDDEQLRKSNEPAFTDAADAKKQAGSLMQLLSLMLQVERLAEIYEGVRFYVDVNPGSVEKPEQAARLHELGCNEAQGYWFSPAVPVDEVVAVIERLGLASERRLRIVRDLA